MIGLQWLGVAGFRVTAGALSFLIDPYLTRPPDAAPAQPLLPADLRGGGPIFLSHGHFDHASDVGEIVDETQVVCASSTALGTALRVGVPLAQLRPAGDGQIFDFAGLRAQAFRSRHVRFDLPLGLTVLKRADWRILTGLNLALRYPAGQVLTWRFSVGDVVIHHVGSAGATPDELRRLAAQRTDVLLLPLQGHSQIVRICLDYVVALRPRLVIPHHWDDFLPPISQLTDVQPFAEALRRRCPEVEMRAPALNETIYL